MSSITIHNIDPELDNFIRNKASDYGYSLNKTIKKLLAGNLDFKSVHKKKSLDRFIGVWTKNEAKKFEDSINEEFEKIDKDHN